MIKILPEQENRFIYKWFNKYTILLTLFLFIYISLLVRFGGALIAAPTRDLFLPGIFICTSILILIIFLTLSWVNLTEIVIEEKIIRTRNYPFPFPLNIDVEKDGIIDVYARNIITSKSIFQIGITTIMALNENGIQKKISGPIFNREKAESISNEMKEILCSDKAKYITGNAFRKFND